MPNIKISALTDNPTPAATANTVVQETGSNSKVTLANLVKAAVNGGTAASVGLATVAKTGAYSDLLSPPTLGTIASQDKTSITITGGSITGITDLAIADGGTGASTVGGAVTALGLEYADTNTALKIVQRDASGNFAAGTITASLTGNAPTATTATTATNLAAGVAGAISYQSGAGTTAFTAAGVSQQVLISNGTSSPTWIDQSKLTVSASGLIGNQTEKFIYAGPTTAPAAVASFRAMVSTDVPLLNQNTTGTAAGLSATLVATSGGTGLTSYAVGDLLYASSATALNKLPAGAVNTVLHATGPSSAPVYGKVVLTTEVSGALPLVNGGTGTAAGTAAAALNALLPSQTGNPTKALITDGTNANWSALGAGTITNVTCTNALSGLTLTPTSPGTSSGAVTISLSGTLGTANGGTGAVNPATALTNLGAQPVKANLTSFGNVTGAADRMPYFNGTTTMTVAPLLKVGRDFLALTTKVDQANYINSAVSPVASVALDPCGRITTNSSFATNAPDNDNVTALYYAPYKGDIVQLYDIASASWISRTLPTSMITLSLTGLTASTGYDFFIYWNGTAVLPSAIAWNAGTTMPVGSTIFATPPSPCSNPSKYATSRQSALVLQNGRYVLASNLQLLYVGSFHTNNTTGQTSDTLNRRLVTNHYHRTARRLRSSIGGLNYNGYTGSSSSQTNYANLQPIPFGWPMFGGVWVMSGIDTEVSVSAIGIYTLVTNSIYYLATHKIPNIISYGTLISDQTLVPEFINMNFQQAAFGENGAYGATIGLVGHTIATPVWAGQLAAGTQGFQAACYSGWNGGAYNAQQFGTVVCGTVYN